MSTKPDSKDLYLVLQGIVILVIVGFVIITSSSPTDRAGYKLSAELWTAIFTGFLVLIGMAQAVLFFWQLRLIRSSLADAKITAEAAKKSADTAAAALDRPWLVIEAVRHNEAEWAQCEDALICEFRVSNYGKAPAFISTISATIFHSPGLGKDDSFPTKPLPDELRHFPKSDELREFINKWGKWPGMDIADSPDFPILPVEDPPQRYFTFDRLDHEIAVPVDGQTKKFFVIGTPRLKTIFKGVPIQLSARIFLVGRMIYSIPGHDPEVINFCYQGNRQGGFSPLFGVPYNERHKAT
jgi:hypothetical protein